MKFSADNVTAIIIAALNRFAGPVPQPTAEVIKETMQALEDAQQQNTQEKGD